MRKKVIGSLKPGFEYLEARLTDTCPTSSYYLSQEYAVFKAVRIFDPSVAREMSIDASMVENLAVLRCLSRELIDRMKSEVDSYAAAAADVEISRADVQDFTDQVLAFWRAPSRLARLCRGGAHRLCPEPQLCVMRTRLLTARGDVW